MATEVTNNAPANTDKEKEMKDDAPADNGQTKDETPAPGEKTDEKSDEKKADSVSTKSKGSNDKDLMLYQFPRTPLLPSTSPYCLKVETWLRLTGIKYENVDHRAKFRSKKGQLPFVKLHGEEISDSTFIIKELSEKYNKDLDAALTPEQRVLAYAMISMVENHLSWVIMWWRAKYPNSVLKGYQVNLQNALNTRMPNAILNFCYKLTSGRKGMKKAKAHGIGVHTQEEIIEMGKNDLRVLSDLLADRPFFFGDEPTLLDVVAFSNLAQLHFLDKEVEHPLRNAMNEMFPNLVGLVSRIKERAFHDWDDICATIDMTTQEKPKDVKETKEGTGPAEKQPLPDEPEKGKGDEKEKELEKEPEDKKEKDENSDSRAAGTRYAMISMVENHLSWVIMWWCHKYPNSGLKGYQVNLQIALNIGKPNAIFNFYYKLTSGRKGMKKAKAHGIGVHTQEEIVEMGKNDLRVLSDLLADRPFFFGDEPTLLDVVAFSNFAQQHFLDKEVEHPLRNAMNEMFPNLVGLVSRIKERVFHGWDDICATIDMTTQEKPKEVKETNEGTGPSEQVPLPDEPEKGKVDEKEKELEKEPEDKKEKDEK